MTWKQNISSYFQIIDNITTLGISNRKLDLNFLVIKLGYKT